MDSLWPDDTGKGAVRAPVTILKEQATALCIHTQNIVEGIVSEITTPCTDSLVGYRFCIVAPCLGNYRYNLLSITHSPFELYPVVVKLDENILEGWPEEMSSPEIDGSSRKFTANSEERFVVILQQAFASAKAQRVIAAIIAQST